MSHRLTESLLAALRADEAAFDDAAKEFAAKFKDAVQTQRKDTTTISAVKRKVKSVRKIGKDPQKVYDISMAHQNHHWFFANDILVHNSVYFSAYPILKDDIEAGNIVWTKESVIELYDRIADEVSATFPDFLNETFNVPIQSATGVIQSDREIVALSGLFIKKKRYAALVYDSEGKREDIKGKPGKIKAMGLDLRRSDTPKFVQKFLMEILTATLTDCGESHVIDMIREFKTQFRAMKPWEKGTPKAVNNLTAYTEKEEDYLRKKLTGFAMSSVTIPGHVRAAMNWNRLREQHRDNQVTPILDGQKVVVCKLRDTDSKMTSVAFPSDEKRLPQWFLDLPFDEDSMEEAIVDQKVENLLGVLKWDLSQASPAVVHFNSLFGD